MLIKVPNTILSVRNFTRLCFTLNDWRCKGYDAMTVSKFYCPWGLKIRACNSKTPRQLLAILIFEKSAYSHYLVFSKLIVR